MTAKSSNTRVVPNSGITGQSSCTAADSYTLTVQPTNNQGGMATVTVTVADNYGQNAHGSFGITVKASASASTTGSGGEEYRC